jgi:diketogulonate reductase-like aldo/keto reductase
MSEKKPVLIRGGFFHNAIIHSMRYENIHNITLPKIGLGTGRLGGTLIPNRLRYAHWLSTARSALELGYAHFDTAEFYSLGYSEELIGRAIRETGTKRESIFITSKVWPNHLRYDKVLRACENSLRRLGTDYLDLYLVHWPNQHIPLRETFRALNQLVKNGKVRHIGVSNFNLGQLKEAQSLAESPLLANQVPYSLFVRTYTQNGVLEYCQQNDILLTAYTPISHGNVRATPVLRSIADAHHATVHQIALAWLITQARVIAIPMSFNPNHQRENLLAADIELSKTEMEQLDSLI